MEELEIFCTTDKKYVGEFEVADKLQITDPCYSLDTWCTTSVDLPLGTYKCYVEHEDGRVACMDIIKAECEDYDIVLGNRLAECGVDSGQLGIFNLNKYGKEISKEVFNKTVEGKTYPSMAWKESYEEVQKGYDMSDEKGITSTFYGTCCQATLGTESYGIIEGVGFVSSSGYGDGGYFPRILTDMDGEVIGLEVRFIGDDYEDEEDEE